MSIYDLRHLTVAVALLFASTAPCWAQADPTEAELQWLQENAFPFASAAAGSGLEDLEPLRELIGDARIVALGEGTHGTREYFQMKHRLVEFLTTQMGFTIFSIEASTPEAYEVSDFVVRGEGDPQRLIGGMYFWTWNTEEVLEMVRWMRELNQSDGGHIEFTGFDMQTPDVAMQVVQDFLSRVSPEQAAEVGQRYSEIKNVGQAGGEFGVATYTFPVAHARGKRVRYRGFIKTRELNEGFAGLWWRVDGADRNVLAFDNMATRGPRGTTDWTEYSIDLDVAEEAENINFGVLMPGNGTAWFDGLSVLLDGETYTQTDFDLGFETAAVKGYASQGGGYRARMDTETFQSGLQSLMLESLAPEAGAVEAPEAVQVAQEVLAQLEDQRDEWLETQPEEEVEWAIHNARIIAQGMRAKAGQCGLVRDESMASNVEWILEQNPGAKIILWAHNGHVSRTAGAMGSHLAERFGDAYLPVAFAARRGEYYAMSQGSERIHDLQPPPPESIESFFSATGRERLILDLRKAQDGREESAWLTERRPFRSIGAMAMEQQFFPVKLSEQYDALIYFDQTAPAIQLDTPAGR
jgi:erythromycin esterase-like protein